MNQEQQTLLGNDYGIALLPDTFRESMKQCQYDYRKNEHIEDVCAIPIGKLGKFWKFIDGVKYLHFNNSSVLKISQERGQKSCCLVPLLQGVEKVIAINAAGQREYPTEESIFKKTKVCAIDFDFRFPIKQLILHFNFGLADPLILEIETELFVEPEIDETEVKLKKMKATHSCGQNLVNIRFQNCDESVVRSEILLYDGEKQFMARYLPESGVFFQSIPNLAYEKYFYRIRQYGTSDQLIAETDFIAFKIAPVLYGGKPMVFN